MTIHASQYLMMGVDASRVTSIVFGNRKYAVKAGTFKVDPEGWGGQPGWTAHIAEVESGFCGAFALTVGPMSAIQALACGYL